VKCSEVQERLSLFHDNHLSQDEAARVAVHTTDCSNCAEELTFFQQLSGLSRQLTDPPVPAQMWEELQSKVWPDSPSRIANRQIDDLESRPTQALRPLALKQNLIPGRILTLAATILVAIGIGTVAYQIWPSPGIDHLAVNFVHYQEEFSERPDVAQQILLAKYDGRPMTMTEATKRLGYEPVAAKGLPPGYTLEEVHLLTMPCCTCAQVICTNKAGKSIAIFEHDIDQPVWFGDRPTVEGLCHNVPTTIRQIGDRLAATWKVGERHLTIIGATDLNEVTEFVAHFKRSSSG